MMYARSESDIASSTTSPLRSPKYIVQSPSCDSHEEDSASTQGGKTPVGLHCPSDSESSLPSQSSSSAKSRVSGYHRKRREMERERERERERNRESIRLLAERRHAAEMAKDGELDEDKDELSSRSWNLFKGVMVVGLLVSVACFVLWGVSRPFSAHIFIKDVAVNNFYFGEGIDHTGVPSKILTINCSLRMRVHNPATFFGIHVSCSTFFLRYYDLTIASGQLEPYYQPRNSWRTVLIGIEGSKVPLYGAGPGFVVSDKAAGIPMVLEFEMRSRGEVLGKLMRTKHHRHMRCLLNISSHTHHIVKLSKDACNQW